MNSLYLGAYDPTYSQLLDKISHYTVGTNIYISGPEYISNKHLYDKAVEDGYILPMQASPVELYFVIVKLPIKELDEDFIDNYYK